MPWRKFSVLVCLLLRKENFSTFIHGKKILFLRRQKERRYQKEELKREKNPKPEKQPRLKRAVATAVFRGKGFYLLLVCQSKALPLRAVQMSNPVITNTLLLIIWMWLLSSSPQHGTRQAPVLYLVVEREAVSVDILKYPSGSLNAIMSLLFSQVSDEKMFVT